MVWKSCNAQAHNLDHQVFHVSHFIDDSDDPDVFNWAGADGRALGSTKCEGYKKDAKVTMSADTMDEGKRWQMLPTNEPLKSFRAHLGAKNGAPARNYEFRITALDTKDTKAGNYGELMIKQCKTFGMKPVWYKCLGLSVPLFCLLCGQF